MEYFNLGTATPEFYDGDNKVAMHVLNVNFVGEAHRSRVLKFVCARIVHFHKHLPKGSSQRVRFDLRGQWVSTKNLEQARHALVQESAKHGVHVEVDFLTG